MGLSFPLSFPTMGLSGGAAAPAASAPNNSFYVSNYASTPSTADGTLITTGGVAHTKTGYTELITAASVTADLHLLEVIVHNTLSANTQSDVIVDIAFGGAGSEVVQFSLICGYRNGFSAGNLPGSVLVPILCPSGTRISASAQSLQTTKNVYVAVKGFGFDSRPNWCMDGFDVYGLTEASSQGTSITAGNTGVYGSWTSIGSATSRAYDCLIPLIQGPMTGAATAIVYHWQAGISDTALGGGVIHRTSVGTTEAVGFDTPPVIFGSVAQGAQLQMRGKASGTAQAHDGIILAGYTS